MRFVRWLASFMVNMDITPLSNFMIFYFASLTVLMALAITSISVMVVYGVASFWVAAIL